MAILKPSPSPPSRFAAGTTTSWKAIAEVSVERWPILSRCFSTVTPSASMGTTKAERPLWPLSRSVDAKQTIHEALPPFVMNIFEPLITYSSPRGTAVVWMPDDIGAGTRLGEPEAPEDRLLDERRQPLLLLLLAAGDQDRAGGQAVGADGGADPRAAEVELLADEHPVEAGQLGPAQRLRQVQVHEADLVRLGDDVGRLGLVLVVLRRLRADLLLGELSRERAQLALLVGERERHATRDACLDRGHGCLPGVD